jgi:hypothetical protein
VIFLSVFRVSLEKAVERKSTPLLYIIILLQLPLVDLHGLFAEAEVAVVAALADFTGGEGPGDGAAGLFSVGAVAELALT